MFINCYLIKNTMLIEDIGETTVFGVACNYLYNLSVNNIVIKDISVNPKYVFNLVNLINSSQVSSVHIYDVVYDYLVS